MKNLTYRISKYPKLVEVLGRDRVDKEVNDAFQVWETATDLTFTRKTTGKVHIEIRFESREHGDGKKRPLYLWFFFGWLTNMGFSHN